MHDFTFAGRGFAALPERALYWPVRRALLVADLHFEKASWFARTGQMLPPFDSRATCAALLALVERVDPAEIWALGDSFHDNAGPERIDRGSIDLLARIGAGRAIHWIAGNHDGAADLPGERIEEAEVDGIILRHEALPGEARPEISGHYHPKLHVRTAIRSMARPCFVCDGGRLILPAFGALTGGLDATDPAISGLFAGGSEALVATQDKLLRFPLSPRAARHRRKSW
jgi:uncharacterized protein